MAIYGDYYPRLFSWHKLEALLEGATFGGYASCMPTTRSCR